MQKLFRPGPPFLPPSTSLPLSTNNFLSLGFHTMSSTIRLPCLSKPHFPNKNVNISNYRPCNCSIDTSTNTMVGPLRAWAVSKDGFGATFINSRRAWFTTLANSIDKECSSSSNTNNDVGELLESSEEKVKQQQQRRVRTSSSSSGGGAGLGGLGISNPDLLEIPGVGPRNLRKLVDKGFEDVHHLKKLYKAKFYGKEILKMVEYLQSSVGIIHKNHAESITTFIKERVDEEEKEELKDKMPRKKRITMCVEGNISVGKSTFLQRIANETLELKDLVEIVPEPIDKWKDVGKDHLNILDAFYKEPEKYAYTFQNFVFATRVGQEKETSSGIRPLRLMERSVFSDRMVFVRAVHEAKWMSDTELVIYESCFDPVVSSLPGLVPDGFIYLRASPDTCHKRMMMRKREEEGGVTLDYLQGLHEKHESWLFPLQSGNHGVLSVSNVPKEADKYLLPNIRDRVFYLEGDHMHSSIQKVPALVLDCEPDIDFNKDIDAKREYARQVAEFFEFVKKSKENSDSNMGVHAAATNNKPQVICPTNKNLWMPPGLQTLPNSALEPFQRAFSCTPQ